MVPRGQGWLVVQMKHARLAGYAAVEEFEDMIDGIKIGAFWNNFISWGKK